MPENETELNEVEGIAEIHRDYIGSEDKTQKNFEVPRISVFGRLMKQEKEN